MVLALRTSRARASRPAWGHAGSFVTEQGLLGPALQPLRPTALPRARWGSPLLSAASDGVLPSCSGFFYSVFLGQGGREVSVLTLPSSIEPAGFQALLDFMYTSRLLLTPGSAPAVLAAASYLQMEHVVESCHRFIQARYRAVGGRAGGRGGTGQLLSGQAAHSGQRSMGLLLPFLCVPDVFEGLPQPLFAFVLATFPAHFPRKGRLRGAAKPRKRPDDRSKLQEGPEKGSSSAKDHCRGTGSRPPPGKNPRPAVQLGRVQGGWHSRKNCRHHKAPEATLPLALGAILGSDGNVQIALEGGLLFIL